MHSKVLHIFENFFKFYHCVYCEPVHLIKFLLVLNFISQIQEEGSHLVYAEEELLWDTSLCHPI